MSELILQTRDLTRRYGRTLALDHAALSVEKGQIFGLVGRNGAGKTTLIRLISGQSHPTAGEITLFGASTPAALDRARSRTGAMVEIPSFYPYLTARQNLEYYRIQRGIPGKECVDEALEQVRLTDTGKKKFKTFSLGMKQRLGLALALMNHPEFLLLDEPINGLDPEGIVEFRELLLRLNRERQTTILISSHILSELSTLATHYAFIEQGRVLESVSASRLREKCRECLELTVDDAARAARVLEEQLGTRDFEVLPKNRLRLYTFLDQPQTVNRVLLEHGVGLISAQQRRQQPGGLLPLPHRRPPRRRKGGVLMLRSIQAECYKVFHRLYFRLPLSCAPCSLWGVVFCLYSDQNRGQRRQPSSICPLPWPPCCSACPRASTWSSSGWTWCSPSSTSTTP